MNQIKQQILNMVLSPASQHLLTEHKRADIYNIEYEQHLYQIEPPNSNIIYSINKTCNRVILLMKLK